MKELTDKEKQRIKELYDKGYTSTDIAKELGIRRQRIDADYKELSREYPRERKRSEYYENVPLSRIRADYLRGDSKRDIAKRYHLGTERLESIIDTFPESVEEKHNERVDINKGKTLNATKTRKDFKKLVKNPQFDIYCVIELDSAITIKKNSGEAVEKEHITQILTFGIKSLSDFQSYADSLDRNFNNLANSFTPYCFNSKSGKRYSTEEIAEKYGYYRF